MTSYDHILPLAKKIVSGLSAKPGVRFIDKEMVANWIAQVLAAEERKGELTINKVPNRGQVMTKRAATKYMKKIVESADRSDLTEFNRLADKVRLSKNANLEELWMVLNCQGPGNRDGVLELAKKKLIEHLSSKETL